MSKKELIYLEKVCIADRFGKEETIDTEMNTLDLIDWEVLLGKIKTKLNSKIKERSENGNL